LPFGWVTFDEHFGRNPTLLDQIDRLGLCYLAEVPHDSRVWLARPATEVPPSRGKGRHPSRERLVPGEPPPIPATRLAGQLPSEQWARYQIKEGAKGPLVAEFAFLRGVAVRDDLPGPDVWVVFRRSVGKPPELKVYLSNAPPATPHDALVRVSGMRWPVESAILECKDEVGMDHYEVRGWVGWHHHLTLSFLAHLFLVRMRVRLAQKGGGLNRAPGPSPVDRRVAASPPGRVDGPRADRRRPTRELRGLPVASAPHHRQARLVVEGVG
jgi:SRSO17 transposase